MIINHNIPALNTYRQMGVNQNAGSKAMEKLSSGLRINRAGDDAAGLAISEKMRAQIKGLDQASRNSQDGISMIQTAEGALQETHNILQRMRELATQASNDTNVAVDRNEIQKEMNALTSEINRIGNTTEFNTQKILKGDGSAPVGKDELSLKKSGLATTPTSLAGGNLTPAKNAAVQVNFAVDAVGASGTAAVIDEKATFNFNGQDVTVKYLEDNENFKHGEMTVNDAGNEVTVYLKDGTKKETIAMLTEQALKKAIESNSDINKNDYNITRDGDSLTISTKATGTGQSLKVTGVATNILASDVKEGATASFGASATSTGVNAVRNYATAELTLKLADITNQVLKSGVAETNKDYFDNAQKLTLDGLKAHLAGSGLTIGDETIEFYNGAEGEYKGTADFAVDLNEVTWATASGTTAAADGDLDALITSMVEQIGDKMKNVELHDGTYTSSTGVKGAVTTNDQKFSIIARGSGKESNSIQVTDGVNRQSSDVVGSTFKATFQIGANQGQSMTIEIGDMRAEALNITGKSGGTHTTVEGAKFTSANNVTNGTNNEETTAALDISTHESATAAIKVINNAIEKVSAQRSNLGAFQNRLEHTISNLSNASENLTAAESRIRDVDMAKEVMEMTRANILGQASQAMLAQANQKPQSVLQLLG